jgi:diguanylate cyclase (GGDEF)-like protein
MAIQLLMSLVVVSQVSASGSERAWLWATTLLFSSLVLVMWWRTDRMVLALTMLDTAYLLSAASLEPAFDRAAVIGVVGIILLISYSASLPDRVVLALIVAASVGGMVHHWGLLTADVSLLVLLSVLIMVVLAARDGSLVDLASPPLSDAPVSASGRDVLTGLPNRQAFLQHVWGAIHWRRRNPTGQFAVLFIDLDNFKPINDHLGHQAGDTVLQRVAKRLQARLKATDVAARYGGDEFVLLLQQVQSQADVARVAERLVLAIQEPIDVGQLVSVGASIGIALSTNVYAAPEDLIKDADAAMYRAKAHGKNHYVFSEQSEDASPVELKARLRRLVQAWSE